MGEARAHNEIAMLAEQQGRIAEALGHAQLSLALYRDEGLRARAGQDAQRGGLDARPAG